MPKTSAVPVLPATGQPGIERNRRRTLPLVTASRSAARRYESTRAVSAPAGRPRGTAAAAGRRSTTSDPTRGVPPAPVGDRGVHDGDLERGDADVTLADREVRGVTGAEEVAAVAVLDRDLPEVGRLLPVGDLGVAGACPLARLDPGASHDASFQAGPGCVPTARRAGRCRSASRGRAGGHGDERVAGVARGGEPALRLPRPVGDRVEDRVARDLDRLAEADQPPARVSWLWKSRSPMR